MDSEILCILEQLIVRLREYAQYLPSEQSKGMMLAVDIIESHIEIHRPERFS